MSQSVSKSQFKPHSLEYFRRIEQTGEELVITDHGRPVLKVVPYVADTEECFRGSVTRC
jgi:prevent-host-death family protein